MPRKAAVLLGHSHTGALTAAIAARTLGSPDLRAGEGLHIALFEAWKFGGQPPFLLAQADGELGFNPAVIEGARAACLDCDPPAYFTLFGGNGHTVLSLMRHERPYDFVLPGHEDLPFDEAAELVPLHFVQSLLQAQMDPYLYQLYRLRMACPAARLYALAPPPPIGDDAFLAPRLDAFFVQNYRKRDLSPPHLRLKMWHLQIALQRRLCEHNAVELLEPPAAARTAEGFLAPDCYGADATHGGQRYGDLALQQIETCMDAKLVSWKTFSPTGL